MCKFCSKHNRKKWFLDPDNFNEKMLEEKKRKNILQKISGFGIEYYMRDSAKWMELAKKPFLRHLSKPLFDKLIPEQHSGQVINLDDAIELLKLSDNHVLFRCACKYMVGRKEDMCCINFGPMRDLTLNENPNEKKEEVDIKELIYRLKEWDKCGLIHEVLYAVAPFPVAICNCDRKYCIPMKDRLSTGIKSCYYKGHEVARVNLKKCRACPENCVLRCPVGAMFVDRTTNKPTIDVTSCFGCGLCKTACKYGAIELVDRMLVGGSRGKW